MSAESIVVLIGSLIAAGGGLAGLTSLVSVRSSKRKLVADAQRSLADADRAEADAAKVLSTTALSLLEPARLQVKSLREDLGAAEAKVAQLTDQLELARQEAAQLRHDLTTVRTEAEARMTEADRRIEVLTSQLAATQKQLDQLTEGRS